MNVLMKDPLLPLVRWSNSMVRRWGVFAGPKLLALIGLLVLGAFWGLLTLGLETLAPAAALTKWLTANWPLMMGATGILFSLYWFCRNAFDIKTGD